MSDRAERGHYRQRQRAQYAGAVLTSTPIRQHTRSCEGATASFFLPKRVKVTVNKKDALKSELVAAGFIDTGPNEVDLKSAASLDVGGFHFNAPSLTPNVKRSSGERRHDA
jgi:hypothetical protein